MNSKYEPLETHLRSIPSDVTEVTLSFSEIQSILKAELPLSAYKYREWWSNQAGLSQKPQSKAWKKAGFDVDIIQQTSAGGRVRFTRK